jgi:hypothetical protein
MSSHRLRINRTADDWNGAKIMLAQPVDPRDQRWEVAKPVYRVYFWERQTPERTDSGWTSDEWQLEDADIGEVLEWAQAKAASRQFGVYVEVTQGQPDGLGLVRLLGTDPTDTRLMLLLLSSAACLPSR